jgi:hypothetical protein
LKGGNPSADSPTDTLLRLNPNRQSYPCQPPPLRVNKLVSGITNFRDLTGGVYKTRERIHRDVADSRLLAIPTFMRSSCRPQSELRLVFWDWLPLAGWRPFVLTIVARV